MFDRHNYYTQTEVVKTFDINVKGLKQLILDHQIEVVTKDVDLGTYSVKAIYINKEDLVRLNLEKRIIPRLDKH